MFNQIKSLFKKTEIKSDTVCSISISLKKDATIETALFWPEWDNIEDKDIEIVATEYSVLLHLLSNGSFKNDIISTLEIAKETNKSAKDQLFLKYINYNLQSLNKFHKNSFTNVIKKDSPVISPTSVFKSSKL